jgi:hypothetical protein
MPAASPHNYAALRYIMLGGLVVALLLVANDLIRYPAIVTSSPLEAVIYLVVLVSLIGIYAIFASRGTHPIYLDTAFAVRQGATFGLLVGAMWIVEVLAGNIGDAALAWVRVVYYAAILAVVAFTLVGGIIGGQRSGRFESGALLGLWSGLVSGLIVFLAGMLLPALFMSVLQGDAQTIAEFHRSGTADISTYIVGDSIVGFTNHLWLGPLLGLLLGAIGGFIGANLTRPAGGAITSIL